MSVLEFRVEFRTRIVRERTLEKQSVYFSSSKITFSICIDEDTSFLNFGPEGNKKMNELIFPLFFGQVGRYLYLAQYIKYSEISRKSTIFRSFG